MAAENLEQERGFSCSMYNIHANENPKLLIQMVARHFVATRILVVIRATLCLPSYTRIRRRKAMRSKSPTALSDLLAVYYTASSVFRALCDFAFAPFAQNIYGS